MRNISITIFLVFLVVSVYTQDLIVTKRGESVNGKITRIESDTIFFDFEYKNVIRGTFIPLEQVKHYQYNNDQTLELPSDTVVANEDYRRFRAAFNGGYSYRVAKLSDNIPSGFGRYVRELKSGYHYGLDLSYYFSEQLGFGFKYYNYQSQNEMNNVYVTFPDGSAQFGAMSDDISISFIGPFFSTRYFDARKKNSFLMNIGIGYTGYRNDAVLIKYLTLKGSSLGLCWDIGYDIGLTKNFALGFQLSYMIGTLTQYELIDGLRTETVQFEKEDYESLNRIDFSIGLRLQ